MDEYDALERHQELVHELAAGRQLNTFDSAAVDAVAALVVRREQCQLILAAEGPTAARESGEPIEHPAAKVERQASSELRGWVKDRPDLFGERKPQRARQRPTFGIAQ